MHASPHNGEETKVLNVTASFLIGRSAIDIKATLRMIIHADLNKM